MNDEQKNYQNKFYQFVGELLQETPSIYQSVVGTVYSLIEDKRLISLYNLLKENYPEYYANVE